MCNADVVTDVSYCQSCGVWITMSQLSICCYRTLLHVKSAFASEQFKLICIDIIFKVTLERVPPTGLTVACVQEKLKLVL
jgi:hypothetical protein